jgi:hypothetical protein
VKAAEYTTRSFDAALAGPLKMEHGMADRLERTMHSRVARLLLPVVGLVLAIAAAARKAALRRPSMSRMSDSWLRAHDHAAGHRVD